MRSASLLTALAVTICIVCSACGGNLVFQQSQPVYNPAFDYGYAGGVYGAGEFYTRGDDHTVSQVEDMLERDFLRLSEPNFDFRNAEGRTRSEVTRMLGVLLNTVRIQGEYSYRDHHSPMVAGWNRIENLMYPWTSSGAGVTRRAGRSGLRLTSLEGSLGYVTYVVDGLYGDEKLLRVEVAGDDDFRLEENAGLYIGFAPWGSRFQWYGPIPARERFEAVFARPGERSGSMISEGLLAVAVFNGDSFELRGIDVELEEGNSSRIEEDWATLDERELSIGGTEGFSRSGEPASDSRALPLLDAEGRPVLVAGEDSALVRGYEDTSASRQARP